MENPNILWAQDINFIYLTINILGIKEQEIIFNKNSILVKGRNSEKDFNINLELTCNIIGDVSNWNVNARNLKINLKKEKKIFVNKLTKEKYNNIRIDWSQWVSEDTSDDDDDEEIRNNLNNFKKNIPDEVLNTDFSEMLENEDLNLDDLELGDNNSEMTNLKLEVENSECEGDNKNNIFKINELDNNNISDDCCNDGNDASCELSSSITDNIEILNTDNKIEDFKEGPISNLNAIPLDNDNLDIE